jgi:acetyl esterase/lipase
MTTKQLTLITAACLFASLAHADTPIRLYDGPAPGSEEWTHSEKQYHSSIFQTEVVTNVVHPSLTPFLPTEESTGSAVIIAPGGGFHALSINSEGNDVAKWLNEKGIAAFVLRYRLFPTGKDGVQEMLMKASNRARIEKDMADIAPLAGADGLRAVAHVRDNAEKYKISPDRIGFMGFSAGGAVTAFVALNADAKNRPDFIAPIYAGLGALKDAEVPQNAPPMFIVAATNDPLGLATDSLKLYTKWLDAKKSVELHMYSKGGHGFGMKQQNLPSDRWIERFYEWMNVQGYLEN